MVKQNCTSFTKYIRGGLFMKFLKKHKILSFAIVSFLVLTGANFFMIYELLTLGIKVLSM